MSAFPIFNPEGLPTPVSIFASENDPPLIERQVLFIQRKQASDSGPTTPSGRATYAKATLTQAVSQQYTNYAVNYDFCDCYPLFPIHPGQTATHTVPHYYLQPPGDLVSIAASMPLTTIKADRNSEVPSTRNFSIKLMCGNNASANIRPRRAKVIIMTKTTRIIESASINSARLFMCEALPVSNQSALTN